MIHQPPVGVENAHTKAHGRMRGRTMHGYTQPATRLMRVTHCGLATKMPNAYYIQYW